MRMVVTIDVVVDNLHDKNFWKQIYRFKKPSRNRLVQKIFPVLG